MEPPDEVAVKRARISAKEEQLLDEAGADAVEKEMDRIVCCCGCFPGDQSKTEASRVVKETIIRRYCCSMELLSKISCVYTGLIS
jgi:hypothetical protein